MKKRVVIVGGGIAGLAAAEALSARKHPVVVLEARPRLGGRASSFEDKTTGRTIDNCQHVSLGCCTNFLHFCNRTGLTPAFRNETALNFVGADGSLNRLAASRLPAPLHLAPSFWRMRFLSLRDKLAIARGLAALAKADASELEREPFDVWLARNRQTEAAVNRFWHVVIVSALSESLERVSSAHARKVFVDTFLANRAGWTVQVPTVPLDDLYGSQLTAHLHQQNAVVRTGAGVKKLMCYDGRISAVELRTGEQVEGDEFILAVPHHLARSLLPEPFSGHATLDLVERLETAPISSVHLWFDRPITDMPHAVVVERLSQWVFNRTALQQTTPASGEPYYYQVVISASRELNGTPSEETIAAVLDELIEIWPAAREARLVHSRLVTEHRAVFSPLPGAEQNRLPQQSMIENLQFAGDWTRTGWPATMEGAVRSGYLAASNVLARCGSPERLVRADLPVSRLSHWLFGLS